jgi:hypothetical protein
MLAALSHLKWRNKFKKIRRKREEKWRMREIRIQVKTKKEREMTDNCR